MQHTFQLNTDNLNSKFIDSIKSLFGNKDVEITVKDLNYVKPDEKEANHQAVNNYLEHRAKHPPIVVQDKTDFNEIVDEINL
jgi:S-ribosylhomocysteine lyase LuxS involved in autoinducer biosynthesis